MLKKLIRLLLGERWNVTIVNGDMVREEEDSGLVEYRDCVKNEWIPLENGLDNLDDIRLKRGAAFFNES